MASVPKANALKDAMERAKQIAAKLKEQKEASGGGNDEGKWKNFKCV